MIMAQNIGPVKKKNTPDDKQYAESGRRHLLFSFLFIAAAGFILLKENPHKYKNNDKEAFKALNI